MNGSGSEKALEREGRRVLRRVLAPGGILRRVGSEGFGVFTRRSGARSVLAAEERVVWYLERHDLLEKQGCGYVASAAGRGWLRRFGARLDAFQEQHQQRSVRVLASGERREVHESPLGWLRRRRGRDGSFLIGEAAYEAGERLRRDFLRGEMSARLTVDLSSPFVGGRKHGGRGKDAGIDEGGLAARARFQGAIEHLGPGLAEIVIELCCHLRGVEEAEEVLDLPKRSGKVVLRIALERLARYYTGGEA